MKESDIRHDDLFNEYLRLSRMDAEKLFSGATREEIDCPACGTSKNEFAFSKQNFDYQLCINCETLYQSPRPPQHLFDDFYTNSSSSNFWSESFFPKVADVRQDKIFKPRCERILQKISFAPKTIIDVGAGYGLMLDEWKKLIPEAELLAIEPGEKLSKICVSKGFNTLVKTAESASEWHGKADLLTCFEVIEHAYNPYNFVLSLKKLVKPGQKVLVTGLCADGFDIKLLWESSKNIAPPQHINFMSVKGFKALFERAGFTNIQVETPGKLDVDIVRNAMKDESINNINLSRLERHILTTWSEEKLLRLQEFLAENLLSSHCWIWADRET